MSMGYELLESLSTAHPSQASVGSATERELRGIPLPISGDPYLLMTPLHANGSGATPANPAHSMRTP